MSGGLDDDDEELFPGWVAVVPYPAMLGGTLAGQLVGILIDTAIGTRGVWIPAACSVVLEALVGSRFSGANGLPRLDWAQSLRRSVTYTVVLVCVSAPLLLWVGASHAEAVPNGVGLSFFTPTAVALALVVLAVATAIRAALLTVFASWSSKGGQ